MSQDKLIWSWNSDGTVMYVLRVYQTRFFKRFKLQPVRTFYTSDFDDVKQVAEDFISRYEQSQQSKKEGSNE